MFRDYGSARLAHLRNSFVQIKVKSVEVYTDEKISQKNEFCFLSSWWSPVTMVSRWFENK